MNKVLDEVKENQRIYQLYVTDWMFVKTRKYDEMIEEDCSDFKSFNQFMDSEYYKQYYQIFKRRQKLERIVNEKGMEM